MNFVTIEELNEMEEMERVDRVENNGVSGIDGNSVWYTVYYRDGEEEDVYVKA